MGRVVLVTGVARALPAAVARALAADPRVDRVIGLDDVPEVPVADLTGVDVVRADLRSPAVATVVQHTAPDVVVHLGMLDSPAAAGGRAAMKEINVIASMQLLAACQRSASVRRVVIGSTAAVYGSSPRDPALVVEDGDPAAAPHSGWGRDCLEVEGYARGLARRRPDVDVLALRPAELIGPGVRTPLSEYLALPAVPTVLGFDPRLQFLHPHDAVAATVLAAFSRLSGAVNLAGDGVLLLSQAAHLAGRVTVPVASPLAGAVARTLSRTRVGEITADQQAFLRYGRALDTTRMRRELGFTSRWTTREAFADFVRARHLHGPVDPDTMASLRRGMGAVVGGLGLLGHRAASGEVPR